MSMLDFKTLGSLYTFPLTRCLAREWVDILHSKQATSHNVQEKPAHIPKKY